MFLFIYKKYEFLIGRPHGPPTAPGEHHSFANSTEAAMAAKLVRSLITIASY